MMTGVVTAIDSSAELAQIREIAEPHMWISEEIYLGHFGQYELRGIIKPTPSVGPDTPAWQMRRRMLDQADQFIEALAKAGWQVMDSLRLEFTTEIRNFSQSLAGVLMIPSEQMGTTAEIRLRVGRPR